MLIGICDDSLVDLNMSQAVITDYLHKNDISYELRTYHSLQELSHEKDNIQVLFLDIEIGTHSGIQAADKIKRRWPECQIVYLTQYINYASDVYKTHHAFFVVKGTLERYVDDVFEKVFYALKQNKKLIFETVHQHQIALTPESILYMERRGRKTVIVTRQQEYFIAEKIPDVASRLAALPFVRTHNSYIVYLPALSELTQDALTLTDGTRIPISRKYKKTTRDIFLRWAKTQLP